MEKGKARDQEDRGDIRGTGKKKSAKSLDDLKAKVHDLTQTLKHVQADYINFKKRTDRDREKIVEQANRDILREIISVVDIFDMALSVIKEPTEITKGFEMVYQQLLGLLKKHHVEIIDQVNVPIDPKLHEVIGDLGIGGDPNNVIEIYKKGYKLHDYVIRPAQIYRHSGRGCGSGEVMVREMEEQIKKIEAEKKEEETKS